MARRRGGLIALLGAVLGLLAWLGASPSWAAGADTRESGATSPREAAGNPTEYELKTALLLRVAQMYVTWPEGAFADKTAPLVVQIVGKDPFGKQLDDAFAGKKHGEHPFKIVRAPSADDLENCHILFVPRDQERHLERIREVLRDRPTLVIAESAAAARKGAHIGLYLERSRLRFAINNAAAKRLKLLISSELLKLAKVVEDSAETR